MYDIGSSWRRSIPSLRHRGSATSGVPETIESPSPTGSLPTPTGSSARAQMKAPALEERRTERAVALTDKAQSEHDHPLGEDSDDESLAVERESTATLREALGVEDASNQDPATQLEFNLLSYESTLHKVLMESVKSFNGDLVNRKAIKSIAEELSWVPSSKITDCLIESCSSLDTFKAWVEDTTRTKWQWWPLAKPKYAMPPGCRRLVWRTVSFSSTA